MNKFVLLFLVTLVVCEEVDLEAAVFKHFQRFIKKYNKQYSSMNEYLARFNAFRQNVFMLKMDLNHIK